MPRAAFGFLTLGVLGALEVMGVVPAVPEDLDEAEGLMREVLEENGPDAPSGRNPAKALARSIGDRVPVVWGPRGSARSPRRGGRRSSTRTRRSPAFASEIPELDHNEVVGWSPGRGEGVRADRAPARGRAGGRRRAVPALDRDRPRLGRGRAGGPRSRRSALARLLTLTLQGDLVATYLGIARGEDPSPIEAIAGLKRALAES